MVIESKRMELAIATMHNDSFLQVKLKKTLAKEQLTKLKGISENNNVSMDQFY